VPERPNGDDDKSPIPSIRRRDDGEGSQVRILPPLFRSSQDGTSRPTAGSVVQGLEGRRECPLAPRPSGGAVPERHREAASGQIARVRNGTRAKGPVEPSQIGEGEGKLQTPARPTRLISGRGPSVLTCQRPSPEGDGLSLYYAVLVDCGSDSIGRSTHGPGPAFTGPRPIPCGGLVSKRLAACPTPGSPLLP
jgi:hypothetical protein